MNSRLLALIFTFVTFCFLNVSIAQEKHKGYSPMQITSISPSAVLPSKGDKPKPPSSNIQKAPCNPSTCAAPIVMPGLANGVQTCVTECNNDPGMSVPGPDFNPPGQTDCFDFTNETVWFEITVPIATSTLDIEITGLTDPYYAIFATTNCINYTLYDCFQGAGGSAINSSNVPAGATLLIAVSDWNGALGDFTLCITPQIDQSACNIDNTLVNTANSMGSPIGGPYLPGETVSFCYSINVFDQQGCNWLQGIVPTFGDCWDPVSFDAQGQPVSITTPLVAAGSFYSPDGAWNWWPAGSVTYNNLGNPAHPNGSDVGAGWFFSEDGVIDPDNSWGDGNGMGMSGDCEGALSGLSWQVCFDLIATTNCATNIDCSVAFETFGDGEIGNWTQAGCVADEPTVLAGGILCCLLTVDAGLDSSLCIGSSINLNGSYANENGATTVVWTSVPAGAVADLSDPTILNPVYTPSGTGVVTFTLTATDQMCAMFDDVIITTNALPVVTATNTGPYCVGEPMSVSETGGQATSWSWVSDGSATITLGTDQNPTVTGVVDGETFTVTGTDANGCVNIAQTTITINALPNLVITDPAAVCSPNTVDITAAAVTAGSDAGTLSYWADAGATIPLGGPATIATSGTYYIQLTDGNGCSVIMPVVVTINALPNLVITDPAAVCSPNTVDITAAAVTAGSDAGTLSYWTDATATTPLGSPNAVATTGTYYIQLTDGNGCSVVMPVVVTINALPNLVITDPAAVCSPNTVDLTVPAVTAGSDAGTLSYWTDATATTSLATPSAVGAGTYYIQLVDANGCSVIEPVTVTVNPLPTLVITDPAAVCTPGTVDLTVAAVTAGSDAGTLSYWTDATATTPLGSPNAVATSGTYYIQLTDANGCSVIQAVNVVITATPTLVITDPAAVCSPNTVDLTAAAVTAGSDAGPLSYWMDAGATMPLATPSAVAATGTYYIQLGTAGCSTILPVNVTINPLPNLVITDPAAVCSPNTVDITAAAVTAGSDAGTLTYWTDATATTSLATPSAVGAGTYYIQLSDGNGCSVIEPVTVTINPLPNLFITDPAAVCSPNIVDITAAAVTAGSDAGTLTYWADAGATIPLGGPASIGTSGTYYIQLTDGNGCSVVMPVVVTINALPNLIITDPAAVCSPNTVDITAAAVTAGSDAGTLSYWTDATATTPLVTPSAVGAGTYYIQLTDGNGCSVIEPVIVTINALPNLVITDPAAVCSPNTVDLTVPAVTAGSDPGTLTYWTDATATTPLITPSAVGAGTYYIQLTDGNGCSVIEPVNVVVNPVPTFIISAFTDPTACGLSDGTFTISSLTPLTAYTLAYLDDGIPIGPLAIVTDASGNYVVTGLDAGSYTNITISDGICVFIAGPVTLTDPAAPSFTWIFSNPTTCGGVDGSITIQGLTPLTAYNLTYTDDAVTVGPVAIVTDASGNYTITGLNAGTYTNFIVDFFGCVGSNPGPIVLSDPAAPNLVITDPAAVCSPGTVDITAAGVTAGSDAGALTYWTDAGATMPLATPGAVAATGTYYIQLNVAGCISIQPVNVTINALPNLVITDPAAVCSPGTVDITAAAVTAGSDAGTLTYWTDATATTSLATPSAVAATGTYYIQLVDANGCLVIQAVNVTINPLPSLVITDPAAVCSPGTVDITAAAVTAGSDAGALTYWANAGATIPLGAPATIATSGTYYIQLTDGNGCSVIEPVIVTINALPNLVITDPAAVCSPNTVDLTAGAVTAGSDAGTLSYWTDATATTPLVTPSAVGAGTYYIQLVDANGCSVIQAVTVTINALPNLVITDPAAVCSPNTVDITAAAVTAGSDAGTLTYWTDATATTPLATPSAVGAGTYYIQLVDANGCSVIQAVTVTINPLPNLVITDPAAVCTPGTADLTVAAVTAGSDAGTLSYWTDATATTPLGSPNAVATTGTYYIQLTDANGCSVIQAVNVVINPLPNLVITDPEAVCSPNTVDLTAVAVTAGSDAGTLSYWMDAGATIPLATPAIVAATGTYYIQLTDVNGCSTIQPINVVVNPLPNLVITDPAGVCSPNTVDITAAAVTAGSDAGTLSYWTDATATTPLATPSAVGAGTYYIQLVDANGCSVIQAVTVTINALPNLVISDPGAVCSPVTIDLTAIAVTAGSDAGALTYWANVGATIPLGAPSAVATTGTYYIQLVDVNGCSVVQAVNVSVNPLPNLVITDPGAVCSPGTIDITAAAVTAGSDAGTLTYWTDAVATIPFGTPGSAVVTGVYYIQLMNANGCSVIQAVNVTINPLPNLIITDPAGVCSPGTVDITAAAVTAGSGAGTFSYWQDAAATLPLTGPSAIGTTGTYYIQLTNLNGCSVIQAVNATVNQLPSVVATNDGPICSGSSFILNENGGNAISWLWNTSGSATIISNTDQSPIVTGAVNGEQFDVLVTDINGCTNLATTTITVILSPILDPIADVVACDTFDLPVITGTNLTGSQSYYNDSQSNGGVPFTGPITSSQLVWVYDANGICSSNTNFNVTINPSPTAFNMTGGGTYCQGDPIADITVEVTGSANWTINYTLDGVAQSASGPASPISLGTAPGVYELIDVSDANCTSAASGTETIVINPVPSAPIAGTDAEYCTTISFDDMTASGGNGTFTWYSDPGLTTSIATGSSLNPSNTIGTTTYYVTETLNNCEGPSSQVVITVNECNVIIPTAFTPDGDLVNDEWEILELDKAYPNNQVFLFNRWGNLLFTSNKGAYNQNRWDGKYEGNLLPIGSYYYIIEFNGEDHDNNSETGTVSIIYN